jgi:2Fe-2S ferredoxin
MPNVTYIEFDGTAHEVDVEVGITLMEGAVNNDVPGIEAQCGGGCSCATCHVYIEPAWQALLADRDGMEEGMLNLAENEKEEHSRLSCQVTISDQLDGLVVRMPEFQG